MGAYMHAAEGEMVCRSINPKIPYFNAPIYLENKTQIGKVEEILGPLNEVYFSVKMQEGVVASSFQPDDKVYISSDRLLPLERFLPKPKQLGADKKTGLQGKVEKKGGRGGFGGGRGGGRGGARGGRGGSFGGGRGGSFGGGRGGGRGGFGGGGRGGSGGRGGFRGGRGRGGF